MPKTNKKGFTLIELLIVIGIISILAGIVLVAVNPAVQFGKANDSERKSEIGTILSAIYQFQTSPTARGNLPQCLLGAVPAATAIPLCDGAGAGLFDGAVQLGTPAGATTYDCTTQLVPNYLRELPIDPASTYTAAATGYYICQTAAGVGVPSRVYVIAPGAEVYTEDGGCTDPTDPAGTAPSMCVSG
jgi:prepilin-type N-terminal cleavage/methylation domain-containing protein